MVLGGSISCGGGGSQDLSEVGQCRRGELPNRFRWPRFQVLARAWATLIFLDTAPLEVPQGSQLKDRLLKGLLGSVPACRLHAGPCSALRSTAAAQFEGLRGAHGLATLRLLAHDNHRGLGGP